MALCTFSLSWTFSIEPGYYEDGKFGIRLENVTAVVRADTEFCFGGKPFMTFDNITMVCGETLAFMLRLKQHMGRLTASWKKRKAAANMIYSSNRSHTFA